MEPNAQVYSRPSATGISFRATDVCITTEGSGGEEPSGDFIMGEAED